MTESAPWLLDVLKVGGPVCAFALALLWATLRDKERMATELNKDKERLFTAMTNLTTVVVNNTSVMESVKKAVEKCERAQAA